ncbi:hypothetical protein C8F04DRAFT_1183476 [Mycena alexandri]|uniref:Uncharacterized protein n=1 Tax=Mycena alexandri TaxID=1745969 RepID=A0AAD6X3G0_9AGAR|nr:hypothetical protein C8F04DRAFT_1183476 [Mycena alexandri]
MTSAFLTPVAAASSATISGIQVPADVLGHILSSCPDFVTLGAAVGVCSTWQQVFETHPTSTVLAVAFNVVGPALPQAVRFVRYPYPEKTPNDWGDGEDGEEGQDGEDEDPEATDDDSDDGGAGPSKIKVQRKTKTTAKLPETDSIGELTVAERMQLQRNAAIVEKLEALFSLRHKNRTSKTSTLTAVESHRFRRAMYRIMLYCELFYLPLNLDDIDSMEDDPGVLDKIKEARQAVLEEYSLPHQAEIFAVVNFLHELIRDVLDGDEVERLKDICLATGPAVILRAHKARSADVFEEALEAEMMTSGEDNQLYSGFFSETLEQIWAQRQIVPPETGFVVILDDVQSVPADKCAQCNVKGVKLWSEANWEDLINVDFCALLRGQLNQNEIETEALVQLFMSPNCGADAVVSEIYDVLLPEFAAWKKDESLCEGCLEKLVGAHLHLWLYKRKIAGGWKPQQKCCSRSRAPPRRPIPDFVGQLILAEHPDATPQFQEKMFRQMVDFEGSFDAAVAFYKRALEVFDSGVSMGPSRPPANAELESVEFGPFTVFSHSLYPGQLQATNPFMWNFYIGERGGDRRSIITSDVPGPARPGSPGLGPA